MFWLERLDPRLRPWAHLRRNARKRYERERNRPDRIRADGAPGDFVYFPLHLEPEENVHVMGGRYKNQLDAIADMHDSLPHGWSLLLKENPLQTHQHRGRPFMDRLDALPNVRFVADDAPSHELIASARLVATINGTAGYEALLSGKACVYFGEAWYAGLPGAVAFRRDLDLEAVSSMQVDKSGLDAAVNAMLSAAADGLAHPRYAGIFRQTHDVATLYREAARSMSIISALLDADPAPPAARRRVGVVGSTRSEALQGRPG